MVDINPTISIITLNVNGLNTLTKRQISEWMGKKSPVIRCPQETHFIKTQVKSKGWRGWGGEFKK